MVDDGAHRDAKTVIGLLLTDRRLRAAARDRGGVIERERASP